MVNKKGFEKLFSSKYSNTWAKDSVTRLSYLYFEFWTTNFLTKIDQILGYFLGYLEKSHFKLKPAEEKIWATFYCSIWSHWARRQCLKNV